MADAPDNAKQGYKPADQRLDASLTVQFTASTAEAIRDVARGQGLRPGTWIRMLVESAIAARQSTAPAGQQ